MSSTTDQSEFGKDKGLFLTPLEIDLRTEAASAGKELEYGSNKGLLYNDNRFSKMNAPSEHSTFGVSYKTKDELTSSPPPEMPLFSPHNDFKIYDDDDLFNFDEF